MSGSIFSEAIPVLLVDHFRHLHDGSGISVDVISERGYKTVLGKTELKELGFSAAQQRAHGILIPLHGVDGEKAGWQYRPDNPRLDTKGRPVKYESPAGSANRIDCPVRCQEMLGDPSISLWISEGSKKADALASHGACAISLTGVWGFKGKNRSGGTTILSDWDYITLKKRVVYLAFDSDIVTKEPVRKALQRLVEHLERRGARVLVVHLPQDGDKKTGIDDYLLAHSLEDACKLASEPELEESLSNERSVSGFVLADGTVGEMVTSKDERAFMIVSGSSVRKVYQYTDGRITYIPTGDPLVGQVVHFASTAAPYQSQTRLFQEVRDFVHKYLELPADFEDIASLYVLLSWVYEFAPSVPYLRVIGDWGSGKTRFLQVVGSICFRPIFASGATTPSPVFRILEKFQGTLVFDEADFKDSSAWVEMVKLLNNGYRPGMPVLRAEKENGKWYPRSFQVFGPKLIATRFTFKDEALESRCLTAEMMPLTRDDIPRVLPASFDTEVKGLRARLLTFRLANLLKLKGKAFGNELLEPDLQPRLQEILIPLKAMLNGDSSMAETLAVFVRRLQDTLYSRRRDSQAGRVLAAMIRLHEDGAELTAGNITSKVNEMDSDADLNSQKAGWVIRKLGFKKERTSSSRLICWDPERVARLAAMYGLNNEVHLSREESSESSSLSLSIVKSHDNVGDNVRNGGKSSSTLSQAKLIRGDDNDDGNDNIYGDMKSREKREADGSWWARLEERLGMSIERAVAIWEDVGRPVIHLGPGENCFGLDTLLSHADVSERHLVAIREWLEKRRE